MTTSASGIVTFVGTAGAPDFPTTVGAWNTVYRGIPAFVSRLDPSRPPAQQLLYSTLVGGAAGGVSPTALHVDTGGVVTLIGATNSATLPTTNGAWDRTLDGRVDAFVLQLDPTRPQAQQLSYSTFLGGSGDDRLQGIAIDPTGVVTLAGITDSPNFPTTAGAWDRTYNGGPLDAFVARINPSLPASQQLVYSTFVGGSGTETAYAVGVDGSGVITIAGDTNSINYPTTPGAWDTMLASGGYDAVLTRIDPSRAAAQQLVYSTFVGGATGDDRATVMHLDPTGIVTLAGATGSTDYPTTPDARSTTLNGTENDTFITRFDMLPTGVARYGLSSRGCAGPVSISVASMPALGNAAFALTCSSAPPNSAGLVPLTGAGLTTPMPVLGIDLWVDPGRLWLLQAVTSDARGAADLPLPVPQDPSLVGGRVYAQFVWTGPNSPSPCPPLGLSASAALEITIQR